MYLEQSGHDFWKLLLSFSNLFFLVGALSEVSSYSIMLERRQMLLQLISPKLSDSHQKSDDEQSCRFTDTDFTDFTDFGVNCTFILLPQVVSKVSHLAPGSCCRPLKC